MRGPRGTGKGFLCCVEISDYVSCLSVNVDNGDCRWTKQETMMGTKKRVWYSSNV